MENIKAETPAPAAAPVVAPTPIAPTPIATPPAPGTPEFAAWAWENRGV
jgi:hypothetical protein